MSVHFQDSEQTLSGTLLQTAAAIPDEQVSLRSLLSLMGEHGLLMFCLMLTVPFLLPVSIPGISTVFGVVIILIGIGISLNRVPWLPEFLMRREVAAADLRLTLQRAAGLVTRIDRLTRERLPVLTHGATINRLNGLAVIVGGILLLFPLGLIPLSNTLPALAIVGLVIGMAQRDGLFVVFGYLMLAVTALYFSGLAVGVLAAGQGLQALLAG